MSSAVARPGRRASVERLLNDAEVTALSGLGRTARAERVKRGEFPAPRILSSRCKRWLESEVFAWVAALPKADSAPKNAA